MVFSPIALKKIPILSYNALHYCEVISPEAGNLSCFDDSHPRVVGPLVSERGSCVS
jgi:hypothetical protein